VTIDKNNRLFGEAGVAGPLVEVLKFHWRSAAVMEQACGALANFAGDCEWRRKRGVTGSRSREQVVDRMGESKLGALMGWIAGGGRKESKRSVEGRGGGV